MHWTTLFTALGGFCAGIALLGGMIRWVTNAVLDQHTTMLLGKINGKYISKEVWDVRTTDFEKRITWLEEHVD